MTDRTTNQLTDIFVCVHGIGNQQRNATMRSVANRLSSSRILYGENDERPFHPQPLGYFQSVSGAVEAFPLDHDRPPERMATSSGVAEVFWADIPQAAVEEGRTLEEIKAWAKSVVGRTRKTFQDYCAEEKKKGNPVKENVDFGLAAEVLDEVIDTVRVLERLATVASLAGLPPDCPKWIYDPSSKIFWATSSSWPSSRASANRSWTAFTKPSLISQSNTPRRGFIS